MARGLQKVQSQQKNADALKKAQGGTSTLKSAQTALKLVCPACKMPVANANNLKEHFEAKHVTLPAPDYAAMAAAVAVPSTKTPKKTAK